jgi:periplasmic mercuric ion binding protein
MKYTLMTLVAVLGIVAVSFSQTKLVATAKIKTPGAVCDACKARIEAYLKRYDGIQLVTVYPKRGETVVKYWSDRINTETIKTAIANAGYDADDITANPDSYKLLPKTCKKFEDGGGHPKPKTPPPAGG